MKKFKNLLIIKNFDYRDFILNQNEKEWLIIDISGIKKKYKEILRSSFLDVVFGCSDLDEKLLFYFLKFIFLFIKGRNKYFIDNLGRKERFSFLKFIFIDTPLFILETTFNLLLVLFSWFFLFVFYLVSKRKKRLDKDLKNIIYLRTDNFRGLQQGGSFTHFRGVVKGFYKKGYKIYYIGSEDIEIPKINFPRITIPYPKKFNLPEIPEIYYNWRFIPKALKIIKTLRQAQDILFIYQRHSIFNVCGAILSQLIGIPLILEYNGSEPWVRQKWGGLLIFKRLCYFMENLSLKKADIITVVSKPLEEELIKRKIPKDKILVNYNGVDCDEFNPKIDGSEIRKKLGLESKVIIGSLSTFGVWHGMPVLAQAIKSLSEKLQVSSFKFHVLFIGDGVERPLCERIVLDLGIKDYVTFIGIVPYKEIPKYLAACDILVSPHVPNTDGTPFFGSPTKLFEYMAMGKGIVASDLDQIGEILEHQKTAYLVKPGDVNDLSDGIIQLINDKNLRDNLGKNAYSEAKSKYSWEENVKRIIDFFLTRF